MRTIVNVRRRMREEQAVNIKELINAADSVYDPMRDMAQLARSAAGADLVAQIASAASTASARSLIADAGFTAKQLAECALSVSVTETRAAQLFGHARQRAEQWFNQPSVARAIAQQRDLMNRLDCNGLQSVAAQARLDRNLHQFRAISDALAPMVASARELIAASTLDHAWLDVSRAWETQLQLFDLQLPDDLIRGIDLDSWYAALSAIDEADAEEQGNDEAIDEAPALDEAIEPTSVVELDVERSAHVKFALGWILASSRLAQAAHRIGAPDVNADSSIADLVAAIAETRPRHASRLMYVAARLVQTFALASAVRGPLRRGLESLSLEDADGFDEAVQALVRILREIEAETGSE